jgi:hypothetical protein
VSTFEAYIFSNEIDAETLVIVWNKTQNDDKTAADVEAARNKNERIYAFKF